MQCELCGKETDEVYTILIEGTKLHVCKDCSRYGKIIDVKRNHSVEQNIKRKAVRHTKEREERLFSLVPNFSEIIREKREKLGLKQKEFAKALSIKESLLHKIETGSFEPSLNLARKFEKLLNVKIIEELTRESVSSTNKKSTTLTLGDLVKIKKRKE